MGSKKVTPKSSAGQVFEVAAAAAALASQFIKNMIECNSANGVVLLPNVTSKILSMVIEYCEKHVEMQKPGNDEEKMSSSASGSKKVTLKSSDGVVFEVEEAAALASELIKNMIEDNCANDVIPLPNVTSEILAKVIEYCKKHVEMQKLGEDNNPLDEDLKSWDADFIKVDVRTLYDFYMAADYLNIRSLLDLTYQYVAHMIERKTPLSLRRTFTLGTDFSPKEEEEVTIKEKVGSKKVTLKSSDGQVFEVEAAVALESQTIEHMIEVDFADGVIPLPNITSNILSMVIEYCGKHVEMQKPGDDEDSDDSDWDDGIWEKRGDWVEWYLKRWDADFIKVNRTALLDLLRAANYLKIGSLLDLTIQAGVDSFYKVEGEESTCGLLAVIFF